MTKKFFDMIGYDPSAVQGEELTDVFDTEKVVAARQEYEAAVASYGAEQESLEQDAVEFFNPISKEGLDQLRNNPGGLVIPGVRLRKINDFSDQSFSSFLTVPSSIAEERVRLGGRLFSNPFSPYDPTGKDLDAMIEKYELDTSLPGTERLLDAESPEDLEARAIVTQRRQQRLEQIAIDNQGVAGFIGLMGMSLLDPTLYATGGAATGMLTTRVLNSTTKTGAALRFASDGLTKGEKFKIGATGYLLGEAPIELANAAQEEDSDPTMTLAFMALAPLVGGAFNALGRDRVDSEDFKAAIALDEAIAKGIQGTDSGAVGAAQRGAVPVTVDEDGLPGAPPRQSGWTFGTPLNFLARSADPLVRSIADRLSWNPNTRSTQGTTAAEAQRRIYNAMTVRIRETRLAAKEYFGNTVMSPTTAQLDDFYRQVGQHIEGVRVSDNPAVIRAANAFREGFADGLSYVKDETFVPGRPRPTGSSTPAAPAPPAGPATPPAPAPPPGPATPPAPATPDAPAPITPDVPDAPEPITPEPTPVTPGRAQDYFGRKSFRADAPAKEPEVAPAPVEPIAVTKAASRPDAEGYTKVTLSDGTETRLFYDRDGAGLPGWYLDEGDLYGSNNGKSQVGHIEPWLGSNKAEALANLPERLARTREKFAKKPEPAPEPKTAVGRESVGQVAKAADKVVEAAPAALPSRNDLRVALKGYTEAAEAIAFAAPDAPLGLVEAAAQMRRYLKGAEMGTNKSFQDKYLDGLQRLSQALEDLDTPEADALLATVINDIDSGFASQLRADVVNRALGDRTSAANMPVPETLGQAARAVNKADELNTEIAKRYDAVMAALEFNGERARPKIGKDVATGAGVAGAVSVAAAAFWFDDLDDAELAGLGAIAAAVGAFAGARVGRSKVAKWERESPGIAVFVGPNAKGVDLKAWKQAREMEKAGVDRDTIWQRTGWGRGPDQNWITEADEPMGGLIDDLIDRDIPIDKALRAKRIFEIEPRLRDTIIQTNATLRMLADYKSRGIAEVYDKVRQELAVDVNLTPAMKLRVFMHELNHIAQSLRGGMGAYVDDTTEVANQLVKKADDAFNLYQDAAARRDPNAEELWDAYRDALDASDRYFAYMSQDIEAESRLVERRLGMSRQERRARPPWKDFDVPEDDLWTGNAAMRAMSLGSDLRQFRNDEWWNQNVTEGTFGPDSELNGQRYWKNDQVYAWVEDIGDGEGSFNWDWIENVESGRLFEDNLEATPAQSARAFAFAQTSLERTLKSGEFTVVTFEGLKKPKPGQDMSGHERVQEFLMARADTTGYVATKGSWKLKLKGETVTRSSFAFIREGMDPDEVWQGIRQGKVDIKVIEPAAKRDVVEPASQTPPPASTAAAQPSGPRGLEEWAEVEFDETYLPRQFDREGFKRVFASPAFRSNTLTLGNRLGDVMLRTDPQRFDEIAEQLGITAQEAAWRVGRKYAATVEKLMNPAREVLERYRKIRPDDRNAAKELVREMLNDGEEFSPLHEEAMELLLDIIAPVRKQSAESPRARPRVPMKLDAELDADIIDMFEWNAEKLYVGYARNISGYAGLLRAGFNSAAELNTMIDQMAANVDKDSSPRQDRARREVETISLLRDAILGSPPEDLMKNPHWTWLANQLRRLNFGNLMNNVGFLALSEVAGAMTQVNIVRMFRMFPAYQRYINQARAGDPAARDNIYYLADVTMGHGSAQVRSRVGNMADRAEGIAPSLEDRPGSAADAFDRFTRKQANLVSRVSGMSPIQEFLRMTLVTAEAQDWVRAARNGRPIYSARRMAALGVDAQMWQRISTELRRWGDVNSPDTRRPVPNMDLGAWEDAEALNVFINALDRNANRIVMEGDVGHTAFWLRNRPSAQLLFQFLNFPLTAFSKHLGFALNTRDTRAGAEMVTMALGGVAGYSARVLAQGYAQDTEEERTAYISERLTREEMAKAFVYYSAHGSVIPNAVDLFASMGDDIPGVGPIFSKTRASGLAGDPFTGNPTYSRFISERGAKAKLAAPFKGTKFSEQDVQGVIKHFAPLGNHIALTAVLDRMLEFLPDEEGSVEDEAQN